MKYLENFSDRLQQAAEKLVTAAAVASFGAG